MRSWLSRNLVILVLSQALGMSGVTGMVLVSGILGVQLAPAPGLATLPVSLMIVGTALFVIPAALFMRRFGRRLGFLVGSSIAGAAMLLAALALARGSFALFCLATSLLGINSAFVQQYRFAAVESVPEAYSSRAVAFVLVGGIAAGFLGPEITRRARLWLPSTEFGASFLCLAVLYLAVILMLSFLKDSRLVAAEKGAERPLRQITRQPLFLTAVMCSAVSYGVMSFIMTATPVFMNQIHGFSLDQTAWVIQSHIMAMYLPSLISGWVIEKLGAFRVILLGLAFYLACVFLGVVGRELLHFWFSLVLLGLGWNFLYVSGTLLLTRAYQPAERFKSQAVNDFTVLGIQAFTSLSAGTVLFASNWDVLNLINLPVLALTALVILSQRKSSLASRRLAS